MFTEYRNYKKTSGTINLKTFFAREIGLGVLFIYLIGFITSDISNNNITFNIIPFVFVFVFLSMAITRRNRELTVNLANMVPISYKKRIVFDYISVIINTIIIAVSIVIITLIGLLILKLFGIERSSNESISIIAYIYMSLIIILFSVFTYLISIIKNSKVWLGYVCIFTISLILLNTLVISLLSKKFVIAKDAMMIIDQSSNKLPAYIGIVILLGAIVLTIIKTFKVNKPKINTI